MTRALEIAVGLALGCLGLPLAATAVFGGVAACRGLIAGDSSSVPTLTLVMIASAGTLLLLGARKLLRGSRGAARGRRWTALAASAGLLLVLLAVAIPNFLRFSQRSVSSEPKLVLAAIRTAEESYFAERGAYLSFSAIPAGPPGATPVVEIDVSDTQADAFEALGWSLEPSPPVYCRYAVATGSPASNGEGDQAFTAEAVCDIDGDGVLMAWGYVRPDRETGATAPAPFGRCAAEGAVDRASGRRRPLVIGPCDARSGRDVF